MKKYIVKEFNSHHIYGVVPNKIYEVLGEDENGCYIIRNESGELISIHNEHVCLVCNTTNVRSSEK
jgi:hypothetical protein